MPRENLDDLVILISTHALREEGDIYTLSPIKKLGNFYPRPPRGGRLARRIACRHSAIISTHALREEGDGAKPGRRWKTQNFYPRPPRGGATIAKKAWVRRDRNFYPRPPRGGRPVLLFFFLAGNFISTHALPRGGRHPRIGIDGEAEFRISTHALREEGDRQCCDHFRQVVAVFLPTPSARRATRHDAEAVKNIKRFLPTPSARRATANPTETPPDLQTT